MQCFKYAVFSPICVEIFSFLRHGKEGGGKLVEHFIHSNNFFCKTFEGKTKNYLIVTEAKARVLLCHFLSRSLLQRALPLLFSIFSVNCY